MGGRLVGALRGSGISDDILITRKGQTLTGRIRNKEFAIRTAELGTLKFAKKKIQNIVYKNYPTYAEDQMRLLSGTILNGTVTTTPIRFDTSDGHKLKLPVAKILSIVFGIRF